MCGAVKIYNTSPLPPKKETREGGDGAQGRRSFRVNYNNSNI